MDAKLKTLFELIDKKQDRYVQLLAEAIAIPSVSVVSHFPDLMRMINWTKQQLERFGGKVELKPNSKKWEQPDGSVHDFPPILFGSIGEDKSKKTVCLYCHMDVQPAIKADGWDTEPFTMTEVNGNLYGRGTTDDKGPIVSLISCLEAYKEAGLELPMNIKFCFEALEENGSQGLEQAIKDNLAFFEDVSFICIADNYWLTPNHPCLSYGLRGLCYFFLTVECAAKDLHSGLYGGAVHEAMGDVVAVMNSLVDATGKVLVPGIYEKVLPLTPEEDKLYEELHFDIDSYCKNEVGTTRLLHNEKSKLLQHRWRFPSCSLHGIEGAFYEPGCKTVIPRKVIGKFSIRLVPNMDVEDIAALVKKHCEAEFAKRNSPNKMSITCDHGGPCWLGDLNHIQYKAGRAAMRRVWGKDPNMIREGGSIPITISFEDLTGKKVMLLSLGQSDDGAHSNNEKMSRRNYVNAVKTFAAYFEEAAAL